jgi:hypothetical protein
LAQASVQELAVAVETMFPGPDRNGPIDDESNYEPPEEVTELLGTSSKMEKQWIELFKERHSFDPNELTGEIDGNPRSKTAYPPSPDDQAELLTTGGDKLLTEEFQMHVQAVGGDRIDTLPPKPLTADELSELLERILDRDGTTEYEVWVPLEGEIIERTAIGEYRQHMPGNIIRFRILKDELVSSFSLLPFTDPLGFAWYYVGTVPVGTGEKVMESEESQRLDSLVGNEGDSPLSSTPQRVLNATRLLNTFIHAEDQTAAPDNWLTTFCKLDELETELFQPRYNATFIHTPSEIVLEVKPVQDSTVPTEQADDGVSVDITDDTLHEPTHTWSLSFADAEIEESIAEEFPAEIRGEELPTIMKAVDDRLE